MLSAYLRTRLFKIEKHVLHILKHPDLQSRLSLSEITYAKQYLQTLEQHMTASCLSSLPEAFRKIDINKAGENMVPEPDMSAYVALPSALMMLFVQGRPYCSFARIGFAEARAAAVASEARVRQIVVV